MKVAVVYNSTSDRVINLTDAINRERYGRKSIQRIIDALKAGGHQVLALEGDKDLIPALEDFMPRVLRGERPGMVFNLAYGIQGQARYTHVPGILEMIGLPYVGSGPMAHSLALDKVVAKMIFQQRGIRTPEFAVLESPADELGELTYPVIVKPRNEAVSFGIKIAESPDEVRAAAQVIFDRFQQSVLVERYIAGREVNVGILGNAPAAAFPPAELEFGSEGPQIYTYEDKVRSSGRTVEVRCPAHLEDRQREEVQELSKRAFHALGCADCARVDLRIDEQGTPYVLEVNSLPSLGQNGSFVKGAEAVGLDFAALVNRLVDVAASRYFGTEDPAPELATAGGRASMKRSRPLIERVTSRRDQIEKRLQQWSGVSSRTGDRAGLERAFDWAQRLFTEAGLTARDAPGSNAPVRVWQSAGSGEVGTLLIAHIDVPLAPEAPAIGFRREPERLFGEGVGSSRGPLVVLEYALRTLRGSRRLSRLPITLLLYGDEGEAAIRSRATIESYARRAERVLVFRPGSGDGDLITKRRGLRRYGLRVEGAAQKPGFKGRRRAALPWTLERVNELFASAHRPGATDLTLERIESRGYPNLQPYRVDLSVICSYKRSEAADRVNAEVQRLFEGSKEGVRVFLEPVIDRPEYTAGSGDKQLGEALCQAAQRWQIELAAASALLPSVAGLVPGEVPVVCGVGPAAFESYTTSESVNRLSLMQRTLVLSEFLLSLAEEA